MKGELKMAENKISLDSVKTAEDVKTLVENIIAETRDDKRADTFWDNADKLFLTALCLYLAETAPLESRTLKNLIDLIPDKAEDAKSSLAQKFDELKETNPDSDAVKAYATFESCAGNVKMSVYISTGARLSELAD